MQQLPPSLGTGGSRPVKVFVLDDEDLVRRAVSAAFQGMGEVKSSGVWNEIATEIMRAGASSAPTLLISDIDMPGIDGGQFCRIVRRHSPSVKIILFTGSPERAPAGVADALVPKRAGIDSLLSAAHAVLGSWAAAPGGGALEGPVSGSA